MKKRKKKRILEWVAISFSRESSPPRDPTWVACIAGGFLSELHSRWWFYISINHFYFWPDWIFLAAHRLPMFAGSRGYFSLGSKASRVFSWCSAPLCRLTGFRSISFYVCVCVFSLKALLFNQTLQRVTCRPASRQPARLSGWVQSFQERGVSAGPGWAERLAGATRPSLGLRACACGVPSWSRGGGGAVLPAEKNPGQVLSSSPVRRWPHCSVSTRLRACAHGVSSWSPGAAGAEAPGEGLARISPIPLASLHRPDQACTFVSCHPPSAPADWWPAGSSRRLAWCQLDALTFYHARRLHLLGVWPDELS